MKKETGMVNITSGLAIGLNQIKHMRIARSGVECFIRTIYGETFIISEPRYREIVRDYKVTHDPVKNFKTEYARKLKMYGHKNINKHL